MKPSGLFDAGAADGEEIHTFKLGDDGKSITCLRCERTSHNPNDVKNHYCGSGHPRAKRGWPESVSLDAPL